MTGLRGASKKSSGKYDGMFMYKDQRNSKESQDANLLVNEKKPGVNLPTGVQMAGIGGYKKKNARR